MPELCSFEANATNVSEIYYYYNNVHVHAQYYCLMFKISQLRLTISHDNGKCEFTMELKLHGVSKKFGCLIKKINLAPSSHA